MAGPTRTAVIDALRRGDRRGLIAAFAGDANYASDAVTNALADLAIELRRQNVAVIGTGEAFVRRTAAGELRQVLRPVVLSLTDGTLYQIPTGWTRVLASDGQTPYTDAHAAQRLGWELIPTIKDPNKATVSFEGYLRMNATAGCSVQLPPRVLVDGEYRPNPHVQRDADGDTERIVVSVVVAGAVPDTGNIAVVQYLLDVDPRLDLLNLLYAVKRKRKKNTRRRSESDTGIDDEDDAPAAGGAVQLMARADFNEWRAELDPGARRCWAWTRHQGPIGIAYDLTHPEVVKAFEKYLGICQNAVKKAQTVAMRNAMKRHPALARHEVRVNDEGHATIPVTGWTLHGGDAGQYDRILSAIVRGERVPGVDVVEVSETYDPTRDVIGDDELDTTTPVPDEADPAPPPPAPAAPVPTKTRGELLAELDEMMASMPPSKVQALQYRVGMSVEDLSHLVERAKTS